MKKSLIPQTLFYLFVSIFLWLNSEQLYSQSEDCSMTEIEIVEVDTETQIVIFEVSNSIGEITISITQIGNNEEILYTRIVNNGSFKVDYFENANYTFHIPCENGSTLIRKIILSSPYTCLPPDIEILSIDPVNQTLDIKVNSSTNNIILFAWGSEYWSLSNGIHTINYFENTSYTAYTICLDGSNSEGITVALDIPICLSAEFTAPELNETMDSITLQITNSNGNQVVVSSIQNGDYIYTQLTNDGDVLTFPYDPYADIEILTLCPDGTIIEQIFLEAEECLPPSITIDNFDEENNTMTITIDSGGNETTIFTQDGSFEETFLDGTYEIPFNEDYLSYAICGPDIVSDTIPLTINVVAQVVDMMEMSQEKIQELGLCDNNLNLSLSYVEYHIGPGSISKISRESCWCDCMNIPNPNSTYCYMSLLNDKENTDPSDHNSLPLPNYSLYPLGNCYKTNILLPWANPNNHTLKPPTISGGGKSSPSPLSSKIESSPNPFNHTFNLKLNLPKETFVSIQVYNTLGQPIHDLFQEGLYSKGISRLSFDTSHLPSGLYLFYIQMEGEEKLIKATKF